MNLISRNRWAIVGVIAGLVVTLPLFLSPFGILIVIVAGAIGAGIDAKRNKAKNETNQPEKLGRIGGEREEAESEDDSKLRIEARMRELESEETGKPQPE
jgi:uncharacterized membrane protein